MAKLELIRKEKEMAEAVSRHIRGVCGFKLENCIFDVVAYDRAEKLFKVVECKLSVRPAGIGRTFGQVAAYCSVISQKGREFVNTASERLGLNFNELMEATDSARRIQVAFYVALTRDACKSYELLSSLKALLPSVGIIRVNPNLDCRTYIRHHGEKDYELASARPVKVEILRDESN